MELLTSMMGEFLGSLPPSSWFFLLGLLVSLNYLRKALL
jgi:hypothetical protein